MAKPRNLQSDPPARLPAFCALMLAGCALNVAILLWDRGDSGASSRFVGQPAFAYWLFFIGIQGAIWWPLVLHLVPRVRAGMRRSASIPDHAGALGLAVLTVASGFLFYGIAQIFDWLPPPSMWPLSGHHVKLKILTVMGFVTASLAVLGMAYASVAPAGARAGGARAGKPALAARIRDQLEARDLFDVSLKSLGLLLSAATLATASLRNAVVSFGKACAAEGTSYPGIDCVRLAGFPLEMVLMFGLSFSAVIMLVAVPTGLRIRRSRDDLVGEAAGDIPESITDMEAWLERRETLEKALGQERGLVNAVRDAILILGPLLSALLSTLIPD